MIERRRAVRAHAAGVRALVAVVGPLVVLAGGQREDRVAVGERQHAGFLAVEPFFDHDLVAGVAEFLVDANALDRFERLLAIVANDDAFAGGQCRRP